MFSPVENWGHLRSAILTYFNETAILTYFSQTAWPHDVNYQIFAKFVHLVKKIAV